MGNYPGIRDNGHKESLNMKRLQVDAIQALLDTHMIAEKPDWIYIAKLERKLRIARVQYEHMRP